MRRLEDGVAGDVVDVAAGRDADAADLCRQRVAQVIAVQVERGDHVKLLRPREHLLERDVRDGVLDDDALRQLAPGPAVDLHRAELALGQLIAPIAERAFGVFHDVALVDNREALALLPHGVLEGGADEALGARLADGLNANADLVGGLLAEADLLERRGQLPLHELQDLHRLGAARLVVNAGIDVFRVLAEDDHVHLLRVLHGRRDALEVLHRAQADVEVQHLPQGDVERADAAAHRRGQRALDADQEFLEGLDGVVRQPVVELVLGRLAGIHLEPGDLALAAVGLLHRGIEHALAGRPDIRAGAVAADEREHGVVRNVQLSVLDGDSCRRRAG